VWGHEAEVEYAEAEHAQPYTEFQKLPVFTKAGPVRLAMRFFLHQLWDGGPVKVEKALKEGDSVAGFEVVHVPGHAPGQIALWRASDRLALSTDVFYLLDVTTGEPSPPRVPHDAYNHDTNAARDSLRKLAALDPAVCWPGHLGPAKDDVKAQLEHGAATT
jgi:hydroxyacylglutathione hydrolase